jgi:hypothetical protein
MFKKFFRKENHVITQPFCFKTIRGVDENNIYDNDFWRSCVDGITISNFTKNQPWRSRAKLRLGEKKPFALNKNGVYERGANKTHLYPKEVKEKHSKSQPVTSSVPEQNKFPQPFHHHKERKDIGVGIAIGNVKTNVLTTLVSDEDFGSRLRPTQWDTEEQAKNDFARQKHSNKKFSTLEELTPHIRHDKTNEVLGRLRFDTDGSCCIMIFQDNLPSRMLAQARARDLLRRLKARAKENVEQFPENYRVPIRVYPQKREGEEKNAIRTYELSKQRTDRRTVLKKLGDPYVEALALFCELDDNNFELAKLSQSIQNQVRSSLVVGELISVISCFTYETMNLCYANLILPNLEKTLSGLIRSNKWIEIKKLFYWVPLNQRQALLEIIEERPFENKNTVYICYVQMLLTPNNSPADLKEAVNLIQKRDLVGYVADDVNALLQRSFDYGENEVIKELVQLLIANESFLNHFVLKILKFPDDELDKQKQQKIQALLYCAPLGKKQELLEKLQALFKGNDKHSTLYACCLQTLLTNNNSSEGIKEAVGFFKQHHKEISNKPELFKNVTALLGRSLIHLEKTHINEFLLLIDSLQSNEKSSFFSEFFLTQNNQGNNGLHWLAQYNADYLVTLFTTHPQCFSSYDAQGREFHNQNKMGSTALHVLAQHNPTCLISLLERSVDYPNLLSGKWFNNVFAKIDNNGSTVLHVLAQHNPTHLIRLLEQAIEYPKLINATWFTEIFKSQDREGCTFLHKLDFLSDFLKSLLAIVTEHPDSMLAESFAAALGKQDKLGMTVLGKLTGEDFCLGSRLLTLAHSSPAILSGIMEAFGNEEQGLSIIKSPDQLAQVNTLLKKAVEYPENIKTIAKAIVKTWNSMKPADWSWFELIYESNGIEDLTDFFDEAAKVVDKAGAAIGTQFILALYEKEKTTITEENMWCWLQMVGHYIPEKFQDLIDHVFPIEGEEKSKQLLEALAKADQKSRTGWYAVAQNPDNLLQILPYAEAYTKKYPGSNSSIVSALSIQCLRDGQTGLHAIAQHSPQCLKRVLDSVASSSDARKNLSEALAIQDKNENGGLHVIMEKAPDCLSTLLALFAKASSDQDKKNLAQALLAKDKTGSNGLQIVLKQEMRYLPKLLSLFAGATPDDINSFAQALVDSSNSGMSGLAMIASQAPMSLDKVLALVLQELRGTEFLKKSIASWIANDELWLHKVAEYAPQHLGAILTLSTDVKASEAFVKNNPAGKSGFVMVEQVINTPYRVWNNVSASEVTDALHKIKSSVVQRWMVPSEYNQTPYIEKWEAVFEQNKNFKSFLARMIVVESKSDATQRLAKKDLQKCFEPKSALNNIFTTRRRHRFFNCNSLDFSEAKQLQGLCQEAARKEGIPLKHLLILLKEGKACKGHEQRQKELYKALESVWVNYNPLSFNSDLKGIIKKQDNAIGSAAKESSWLYGCQQRINFMFSSDTALSKPLNGNTEEYKQLMQTIKGAASDGGRTLRGAFGALNDSKRVFSL